MTTIFDGAKNQASRIYDFLAGELTGSATTAAISESVASQLPGRHDGPADVYRHLLVAAELSRKFGPLSA